MRCELMVRYAGAVHHYLLRVARDPEDAADLAQEFSLRFLRCDSMADPKVGRFRNYVKSAALNLLVDCRRRRKNQPRPLPGDGEWLRDPSTVRPDHDGEFLDCWRDEILRRAGTGSPAIRNGRGSLSSPCSASAPNIRPCAPRRSPSLTGVLSKAVSAGWVRQNLLRARERFVVFVRAEVSHSLGNPTGEELDEEMNDLGLLAYCGPGRS